MIPINNSDTAWLIVSDYNQDNGRFYEDLREDIYNPNINNWNYEHNIAYDGDSGACQNIGGGSSYSGVGRGANSNVGGIGSGHLVGSGGLISSIPGGHLDSD